MVHKSLSVVFVVLVVLSLAGVGSAQELWKFNDFSAAYERFLYEVVSWEGVWDQGLADEVISEITFYEHWELGVSQRGMEVSMGYRYWLPLEEADTTLTFMGAALSSLPIRKEPEGLAEYMLLGLSASDLELEVGNTIQLFDGSRVRVVEEETVAGIQGYLLRKSISDTDEAGNKVDVVTSEWVIAPDIAWPLAVRLYQDGELFFQKTLVEYEVYK